MTCPNDDELVGIAIGIADDRRLDEHVVECSACRARLAEARRLTTILATKHAALDSNHLVTRAQLIASLPTAQRYQGLPNRWRRLAQLADKLPAWQQVITGGAGVATIAGLLLLLIAWNSASQSSAMERLVHRLRQVTSMSYKLTETSDRDGPKGRRTIRRSDRTSWRDFGWLRARTSINKVVHAPDGSRGGRIPLSDIEEIYKGGEPGIFVNHLDRTFFRTPPLQPDGFGESSPISWVRKIGEGSVTQVRDLGVSEVDGTAVHGYVVSLNNPDPSSGQNAIELWIDPATDLPIEFRYEERGDRGTENAWTNVMRVMNCQWNIDFEPALFDPTPPDGYEDITPPSDDREIAKIVAALKLYAQLNGGRYPQTEVIDPQTIRTEMLKNTESHIDSPRVNEQALPTPEEIDATMQGFDWIRRILLFRYNSAYYGTTVGPSDQAKALIWWTANPDQQQYRVIYGDLRTEVLPLAEWSKLVPEEVSAGQQP